jgi:hypothetical protein
VLFTSVASVDQCASSAAPGSAAATPSTTEVITHGSLLVNCTPKDLLLDMYEPIGPGVNTSGRPALILAHGGGNSGGSKEQACFQGTAEFFAARGFVTFNIDYRLAGDHGPYPGAALHFLGDPLTPNHIITTTSTTGASSSEWNPQWPSAYPAVRDMKAAVRFVRANAQRFGIDPGKIAVSGGSAGATNAVATGVTFDGDYKDELTIAMDPTLATTHLNESSVVQCVYVVLSHLAHPACVSEPGPPSLLVMATVPFAYMGRGDRTKLFSATGQTQSRVRSLLCLLMYRYAHWSSDGEVNLAQDHDPSNRT